MVTALFRGNNKRYLQDEYGLQTTKGIATADLVRVAFRDCALGWPSSLTCLAVSRENRTLAALPILQSSTRKIYIDSKIILHTMLYNFF